MHLDFAGSGPESRGDLNVVRGALLATVYYAVKAILDPSIPANGGFYRAISVEAPEGTIVNARPPAPVGWRTQTCQRIADVVFGALAQALPDRVPAAGNGANSAMVFSGVDPARGGYYVYLETIGGGAGGSAAGDGLDGVQVHITNTSNLPVECLEMEYPLVVDEYALVEESGGAGAHRGGMGIRRTIEVLGHEASFLGSLDRARLAPWGLGGGKPGGRGAIVLNPGAPDERALPSKVWGYRLAPGSRVSMLTPGAGGWGRSRRRGLLTKWPPTSRMASSPPSAPPPITHVRSRPPASMAADPLLAVRGVVKRFGGLRALDGVSLDVRAGTVTGLIGPNGAGKTTLFEVVSGLVAADAGEIRLGEERLNGEPAHEIARRGLARTFQIPRPLARLTVLENLLVYAKDQPGERLSGLVARRAELRRQESLIESRAREILALTDLDALRHEPAGSLSGGQKKLLELARVLMARPSVVLLDEPGAGVNPALMRSLVSAIRALHRSGMTFLVIEHDMDLVAELCDPVIVLAAGRTLAEGSFAEIRRDPRVLEAYLGTPA